MRNPRLIYSFDTLRKVVRDAKALSKKICLTSGAYDLFHYSHLDLLHKSAEICDFLIVGADSDESVSLYKSYKRPIIPQEERLEIINQLDCVDAVFVKDISFDVDSHIRLYDELMVDLVTIGHNYGFEEKAEEQTQKAGVKLIKLRTVQLETTTSIIEEIASKYTKRNDDCFNPVPKEA